MKRYLSPDKNNRHRWGRAALPAYERPAERLPCLRARLPPF